MEIIAFQQEIVWFAWRRCDLPILIFCKNGNMRLHFHIDIFFMLFPDKAILLFIQSIFYFINGDKRIVIIFMLFFKSIEKSQHPLPLFL